MSSSSVTSPKGAVHGSVIPLWSGLQLNAKLYTCSVNLRIFGRQLVRFNIVQITS